MANSIILSPENQLSDRIYNTPLPGLYFIAHQVQSDERGFFAEIAILDDLNVHLKKPFHVRQINLARSQNHVCRGFHAENWNKLITVSGGTVFCAIADIQPESLTYREVVTVTLGNSTGALKGSLYVRAGLANSYCVVQGPCDYLYCVDATYRDRDKKGDRAVSLFDPSLKVAWPIPKSKMLLSERDQNARLLD